MEPTKGTQRERLKAWMEENKSITHRQAEDELGIMRVAARINELKKMGMKIEKTMVAGKNRYDETVYYAKYTLIM